MIEFCSEALFETRIRWQRISSTNVASNNLRGPAQFSECPFKICNREATCFPIRHRLARMQTVKIDCDVNVFSVGGFQELVETLAPIIAQDRTPALSIFRRPIVCPGMDVQDTCTFCSTIAENLLRPPAFEITATPNAHASHVCELQCTIHPAAASPLGRAHIPIRMIVERDEDDWFGDAAKSQRRQIMEIAGSVEQERRCEIPFLFSIKLNDQARRRGKP